MEKNSYIGFIGTGVMGKNMARNLIKSGYRLAVYNRTREKAEELINMGAQWKDTVKEIAVSCETIITMVGFPRDVEDIYLSRDGIVNNCKEGSYIIDMTTSSPLLAKRIYEKALARGIYALDAPVSGGDIGAREGKLVIMVGGDENSFDTVKPIFEALGKSVTLMGRAGAGQYTKMCNQIAVAGTMIGMCEAISYAKKSCIDPMKMIKTIETGAAGSWSLSNLGPRIIGNDFAPGFYVKHFIKDLNIAIESAKEMGMEMPGLELAKSLYDKLAAGGWENSGTQALIKLYSV